MTIGFNVDLNSIPVNSGVARPAAVGPVGNQVDFGKAVSKGMANVNELQTEANTSIADLLSGKNQDINSVVASVAKADMSFKLLVGVRNKLVDAYKETMKMQL